MSQAGVIWDALESGDPVLVRRAFSRFPEELTNNAPVVGCHLYGACFRGDLTVVQALVELGADINLKDGRDGLAPISAACGQGHVPIVEYLLSLGCELDVTTSLRNPLFACIAGYRGGDDEPRERFLAIAEMLIGHGIDLAACYIQPSMIDMDASAFAYMFGRSDIARSVIGRLYGHDARLESGAWAEAIEVALGNAFAKQKFARWRRPSKRDRRSDCLTPDGDYWA